MHSRIRDLTWETYLFLRGSDNVEKPGSGLENSILCHKASWLQSLIDEIEFSRPDPSFHSTDYFWAAIFAFGKNFSTSASVGLGVIRLTNTKDSRDTISAG
jgi:hypothetical protein